MVLANFDSLYKKWYTNHSDADGEIYSLVVERIAMIRRHSIYWNSDVVFGTNY